MLEYFTYKKVKKHRDEKKASTPSTPAPKVTTPGTPEPGPLLKEEDENFLQRVISAEGTPPPLPDRPMGWMPEAGDSTANNAQMVVHNGNEVATESKEKSKQDKGKGKKDEKTEDKSAKKSRFSFLTRSGTKKASFPLSARPLHN